MVTKQPDLPNKTETLDINQRTDLRSRGYFRETFAFSKLERPTSATERQLRRKQNSEALSVGFAGLCQLWDIKGQKAIALLNDEVALQILQGRFKSLKQETMDRITKLLQIYQIAQELFEGKDDNIRFWLKEPLQEFQNKAPLEMLASSDIQQIETVKTYLRNWLSRIA